MNQVMNEMIEFLVRKKICYGYLYIHLKADKMLNRARKGFHVPKSSNGYIPKN